MLRLVRAEKRWPITINGPPRHTQIYAQARCDANWGAQTNSLFLALCVPISDLQAQWRKPRRRKCFGHPPQWNHLSCWHHPNDNHNDLHRSTRDDLHRGTTDTHSCPGEALSHLSILAHKPDRSEEMLAPRSHIQAQLQTGSYTKSQFVDAQDLASTCRDRKAI